MRVRHQLLIYSWVISKPMAQMYTVCLPLKCTIWMRLTSAREALKDTSALYWLTAAVKRLTILLAVQHVIALDMSDRIPGTVDVLTIKLPLTCYLIRLQDLLMCASSQHNCYASAWSWCNMIGDCYSSSSCSLWVSNHLMTIRQATH